VFVGNIGWWVDEEMLQRVFGEYGTILDAQVGPVAGCGKCVQSCRSFLVIASALGLCCRQQMLHENRSSRCWRWRR
jgi:hypothetical protein